MKQFIIKIYKAIYFDLDIIMLVGIMFIAATMVMVIMKPNHKKEVKEIDHVVQSLDYFKDNRSNLCFVGHQNKDRNYVVGYVPCTPEVESLIADRKRLAESKQ